jgi:hypothetical protein
MTCVAPDARRRVICGEQAFRRLADLWLCNSHYERVLISARIALDEEHEQLYGPREWRPDAPAVVYYIRRASDGLIKIGRSGGFRRRVIDLRAEHGEIQILLTHPGGVEEEAAMHRRFARLRVEGEFFRPRKPLMDWIIKIRRQQSRGALLPGTLPMAEIVALAARPKR